MSIGPPNFLEKVIDNFPSLVSLVFLATFNPLRVPQPFWGIGVESIYHSIISKLKHNFQQQKKNSKLKQENHYRHDDTNQYNNKISNAQ